MASSRWCALDHLPALVRDAGASGVGTVVCDGGDGFGFGDAEEVHPAQDFAGRGRVEGPGSEEAVAAMDSRAEVRSSILIIAWK